MQVVPQPLGIILRRYFYSGWAFLIPYLFAYLLYYWQKWPANSFSPNALGNGGVIPALLHLYWALHAIHGVLAALTLRIWWKEGQMEQGGRSKEQDPMPAAARPLHTRTPRFAAVQRVAPWFFLALIFYIPGVYLEWPADPWEHLRRITEWQTHATVGAHSAGYKSFYFFPYSLAGWMSPAHLLFWLNVYYTGICLLLAWQYYLLAKAVGFNRRWGLLSVVVNVLALGNSCFSFYRYYGLASTIFAQISAIALTRIALEFASRGTKLGRESRQRERETLEHDVQTANLSTPDPQFSTPAPEDFKRLPSIVWLLIISICLLALTAFNHVQGLGIAGLGVMSIIAWRLIEWKRITIFWLTAGAVALSAAAILWWPRNPLIDSAYRPGGWVSDWYGFNIFAWPSPATDRAIQILGIFGLVNVFTAIFLIFRMRLTGWLTVGPIILLNFPFIALPLATSFAANKSADIITFHRMLFAVPAGLVVIELLKELKDRCEATLLSLCSWPPFGLLIASLSVAVSAPVTRLSFNRTWQTLSRTPDDLCMRAIYSSAAEATPSRASGSMRLVTNEATAAIFNTVYPNDFPYAERRIGQPTVQSIEHAIAILLSGHASLPHERPTLTRDPLACTPSSWITVNGSPPQFKTDISDFSAASTALQNQPGLAAHVFSSDLIPVDAEYAYQLEFSIKQATETEAIAYLAVAWYNSEGSLLMSNAQAEAGADNPAGWENGTYSYFGLIGYPVPRNWTTYRKSFGAGKDAVIPREAKFLRVGALLNYSATPAAMVQLTNVRLWQMSENNKAADGVFPDGERLLVVVPSQIQYWAPASQTAQASGHWPPQQAVTAVAGVSEISAAATSQIRDQHNPRSVIVPP